MKLAAIGDVVLTLPALETIRTLNPETKLYWLIGKRASPIVQNHPCVDDLIEIDETIFWQKRLWPLIRLFWRLQRYRFDQVYIFHWSRWFHMFFWLMGIPKRFGFARDGMSFRLTQSFPFHEGLRAPHALLQYCAVASRGNSQQVTEAFVPHLVFSSSESLQIERFCQERNFPADRHWVAIAPGGGHNPKQLMPQRRWPVNHYQQLVIALIRQWNALALLLGDGTERNMIPSLPPDVNLHCYDLAGELSLRAVALLIKKCRVFIGNDSSLTHIAGAVGTPALIFFGPTAPDDKAPFWIKHEVLYTREPCSPCYKYGKAPPCPYQLKCLRHITVPMALDAFQGLLQSAPSL
ncbi:MAG: glycosyltransferase family 9 protein [Elusimicrobia bacterium]|nr:glycosyltransferase family 9 protein [Elusimicrobiota bacterium]